jgi:DNA-binding NarL/FixJ family response regulator
MSERSEQLLDEIVRLMVHSMRQGMDSQNEAILALAQAGFESGRIAELLQTTPATVRASRQKSNKKAKKSDAAAGGAA